MTRTGIVSVILVIGLLVLTFALVRACHSGNEPPIGDGVENEERITDPERAPAEEAAPFDPAGVDTAAVDTIDGAME